jgi:glycosyltransferase involved in cell wall biosynthesis
MKILICFTINKSFLSDFFFEMCKMLKQEGNEVIIFSIKRHASTGTRQGIPYIISKQKNYAHNYTNLFKVIKSHNPDIVISNFNYVYPALIIGWILGVKKNIAWFHTESAHTQPGFFNFIIKKYIVKLADSLIVNSYLLKDDFVQTFKVSDSKIFTVPFYTTIEKFESEQKLVIAKDEIFKIGCPGRLVKGKNQELLIDALFELKKKYSASFMLYLAGTGDREESLKGYIKEKKMEAEVVFLGNLRVNELPGFYKSMDLIVLPSLNEAFGFVFIEAISLGTPVLVSKKFGALQFLDIEEDDLFFVFDPTDKSNLIFLLEEYLKGKKVPSDYFINLYNSNFSKVKTYHSFKQVLQ